MNTPVWPPLVKPKLHNLLLALPLAVCTGPLVSAAIVEDVLVTATRDASAGSHIAASIERIDGDDIARIAHTHMEELAARVPGVWIARGSGQEHLTAIRSGVLTGPGSCGAFYMAEDGIPLRAPGFCNVNQLFDANTEQAGAVEILRGPGTAVHGGNAVNGVVNVLAAMPDDSGSSLRIERGRDNYQRALLDLNRDNLRVTLNATSDGGSKDDAGFEQQKLTLRHVHDGAVWQRVDGLSVTNLNQETAGLVNGLDAYKDDDRRDENPDPEAYRDTRSVRAFSRLSRELDDDRRLVLTPYLRYSEMFFLQHFLPGTPLEENRHYSAGLQSAIYRDINGGRLHYGFDLDLTRGQLEQAQSAAGFGPFPTGQHYDYEVDAVMLGAFAGAQRALGTRSLIDGDIRFEVQDYRYDNRMADGNLAADGSACGGTCRYARPADRSDRFENLSVSAGFSHQLSDQQQLVLRVAQGFRAPQTTELYRLQANQVVADLESEEVVSLEAGLRNRFGDAELDISAYWMDKRNVIVQTSDRRNISDGETRGRGIELSGRTPLTDKLSLQVQADFARHQYTNDVLNLQGNDVDTAPRRTAGMQLQWTPRQQTAVELEWRHVGPYYADAENTERYPGHKLLNLRWREDLTETLFIGARVINLEDTHYAERADVGFSGPRYAIGEARSVYGEIGFRFD